MNKDISEQELLRTKMEVGGTIQDLIDKYPGNKDVRAAVILGAYKCLREHKPLHELSIMIAARAIEREKMRKQELKTMDDNE